MNLKPYTKRKIDSNLSARLGKSLVVDSAASLYRQLETACAEGVGTSSRYAVLRQVFRRAVEQALADCTLAFAGFFPKVDYCIKEYHIPTTVAKLIQQARKDLLTPRYYDLSDEELHERFPHNLKATAYLVYWLCGQEEIPASLTAHFPRADRKQAWGTFSDNLLRAVVERWDDKYIWATEEENNTTLQIAYGPENRYLTNEGKADWSYLQTTLWEGAQLNLVRVRMDKAGLVCLPELIILEPDYLINITTIASCFETYAESPFVHLVNKLKPSPNTKAIHLGNLSGQFLDDAVHGREIAFTDSINDFIHKNVLGMITCDELTTQQGYAQFVQDAQAQQRNISQLIGRDLSAGIGAFDKKDVVLEPAFFSEVLGIQGRLDFLLESGDDVTIIEQKSGKGDFVPFSSPEFSAERPKPKEQHVVQALLYRALFQYEFQKYADNLKHVLLLYSKYAKGLIRLDANRPLLLRAIKMRNLLAWSEIYYAKEGLGLLATLTPEKLNKKGTSGKLWDQYTRPQLAELLTPIAAASPLERLYFLRFLRFIENEQLLSKVGNKTKEDSGFASIWTDTLDDKKAAGNIYDHLSLAGYCFDGDQETIVSSLRLRFDEAQSVDTTNFRTGDIVILYPYNYNRQTAVPNACAQMVHRATIARLSEEGVELRLRNHQTDRKVFEGKPEGTLWAIEHDMFEANASSLYRGMHAFLSAPKARRDLLLSQRMPSIDTTVRRRGEYGDFNTLVERAKQARDLFLIIGPPGTGKTSHGLVNLLKEELLEPGTSVLLLSYTNRAVDEICSKLAEIKAADPDFDFLRIGSDLSCAKEYREHLLSTRSARLTSGKAASELIRRTRVFCGTTAALGANASLLEVKHFSLAIVDESSQILEPHLIGLLSYKKKGSTRCQIDRFVLIGDHKQLPAVVQQEPEESRVSEPELLAIGLRDCRLSLFERLLAQLKTPSGYDERFAYMLTKQGRMHPDIAEFPNRAFYGGRLDIVPLDHQLLPTACQDNASGIVRMLTTHRIAFVAAPSPEASASLKTNIVEARMIAATVRAVYELTASSFSAEQTVGVIVPYRNQISTVRGEIDKLGIPCLHDITIDTVERYQGSQRDYIVYGFTIQQPYQLNFLTSNVFEEDGQLIDRKLNVAMTRARLGLVLIGNPELLRQNVTFRELIEFVKSKGGYFLGF